MAKPDSRTLKTTTLDLLQQYRQAPTTDIRNRLVQLNLGLVRKEVYRWLDQCNESYDDLLQVGSMGLIRAIERFDLAKGHAFSSFAIPYIRGEIQHYLRDRSTTVRIPRQCLALRRQAARAVHQLSIDLGRSPSEQEVALYLNVSVEELQEACLSYRNRDPISLDAPVTQQEEELSLGSIVPDQQYRSFQLAEEDRLLLQQALNKLEASTCKVLEFVFLHDMTQKETAEQMGISTITVSRRLKRGLASLKSILRGSD